MASNIITISKKQKRKFSFVKPVEQAVHIPRHIPVRRDDVPLADLMFCMKSYKIRGTDAIRYEMGHQVIGDVPNCFKTTSNRLNANQVNWYPHQTSTVVSWVLGLDYTVRGKDFIRIWNQVIFQLKGFDEFNTRNFKR